MFSDGTHGRLAARMAGGATVPLAHLVASMELEIAGDVPSSSAMPPSALPAQLIDPNDAAASSHCTHDASAPAARPTHLIEPHDGAADTWRLTPHELQRTKGRRPMAMSYHHYHGGLHGANRITSVDPREGALDDRREAKIHPHQGSKAAVKGPPNHSMATLPCCVASCLHLAYSPGQEDGLPRFVVLPVCAHLDGIDGPADLLLSISVSPYEYCPSRTKDHGDRPTTSAESVRLAHRGLRRRYFRFAQCILCVIVACLISLGVIEILRRKGILTVN